MSEGQEPQPGERRMALEREELICRITARYREMAGLSLTEPQARRLFHIEDADRLHRIVEELVSRGVVKISDEGLILRADASHVPSRF